MLHAVDGTRELNGLHCHKFLGSQFCNGRALLVTSTVHSYVDTSEVFLDVLDECCYFVVVSDVALVALSTYCARCRIHHINTSSRDGDLCSFTMESLNDGFTKT